MIMYFTGKLGIIFKICKSHNTYNVIVTGIFACNVFDGINITEAAVDANKDLI